MGRKSSSLLQTSQPNYKSNEIQEITMSIVTFLAEDPLKTKRKRRQRKGYQSSSHISVNTGSETSKLGPVIDNTTEIHEK